MEVNFMEKDNEKDINKSNRFEIRKKIKYDKLKYFQY